MAKVFNVTAVCLPQEHYMVDLGSRLVEIKKLVDAGKYFTINRARQYGKTTTLRAVNHFLQNEYYVVSMDFQTFGYEMFKNENIFSLAFARSFVRLLQRNSLSPKADLQEAIGRVKDAVSQRDAFYMLQDLFEDLSDVCAASDKKIVLLIDEVDNAANNQVFLDFLAQLRAYYMERDLQPTFQSVILAGVYDVKNLKRKLRPEDAHKVNSPWNIAADFKVDMSFSKQDIAGMLREYEADYHTGMELEAMAELLYDYTSGYPFLVSRLCQLMDEVISGDEYLGSRKAAWTVDGLLEAVKMLLSEKNTLFESMMEKLSSYPELNAMLKSLLFTGKNITYNADEPTLDLAIMFGLIKNQRGSVVVANRIFETRLYNLYLSAAQMQSEDMYRKLLH